MLLLATGLEKSAIIGHLPSLKSSLLQELKTVRGKDETWMPCYRAIVNGRDVAEFYSKCGEKGATVTIVRVDNYIFGGYTGIDWNRAQG